MLPAACMRTSRSGGRARFTPETASRPLMSRIKPRRRCAATARHAALSRLGGGRWAVGGGMESQCHGDDSGGLSGPRFAASAVEELEAIKKRR